MRCGKHHSHFHILLDADDDRHISAPRLSPAERRGITQYLPGDQKVWRKDVGMRIGKEGKMAGVGSDVGYRAVNRPIFVS